MIRTTMLAAIAFMALATAACAQDGGFDPALYVVRDPDSTMYLYGTVHVRPRGTDWGDEDVRSALASAEEIWTEIEISPQADAQAQALATQLGQAPADKPLSSWLTAQENERLNGLTQRLGIPRAYLESMQPWMAGLTLSLMPIMQAGYDPMSGVDRAIDAYGDANRKTMRSFETIEQQLGFFAGLSDETQREFLREAIEEAEQGPAMIGEMTSAWERGDLDTLERVVVDDTRREYPDVYEALFLRRNNAWMDVLVREMQGSGVDFVAVGAGHLLGEDGLVEQFRARGYAVERVGE
ncbi:MAG TPA: TraB/GumN family protein [Candidatus Binatia bacterium]|nr:TraB/GumN family protein [Candidatus Binatia bacterium]